MKNPSPVMPEKMTLPAPGPAATSSESPQKKSKLFSLKVPIFKKTKGNVCWADLVFCI